MNKLQHICHKQKRVDVVSDNRKYHSYRATKRGLPKLERHQWLLGKRLMKIQHGNGVSVVVRARESLVHGEGKQLLPFNTNSGKCVRHYETSTKRIKQSDKTQ